MASEEPHTTPTGPLTGTEAHMLPPQGSDEQVLDELADYLRDSFRITEDAESYKNRRRFIKLKKDELFVELVVLYTHMFNSNWMHFKRVHEAFKKYFEGPKYTALVVPPTTSDTRPDPVITRLAALPEFPFYMALVYISHWILDVYRSIREACPDLSGLAFQSKFLHAQEEQSSIYDSFLSTVNAHIRPTSINGILEDALFIPYFHTKEAPYTNKENPFNIEHFTLHPDYFRNIIYCIQDKRSGWQTKPKTSSLLGRPSWLFDWPAPHIMCAWFPMKENYTVEDCTVAYIIGVSCTSKLAPRDVDDIQFWPHGQKPTTLRLREFNRGRPLCKEAGYIYRSIDTNMHYDRIIPNPFTYLKLYSGRRSKRQRQEPGGSSTSTAMVIRQPQQPQPQQSDMETNQMDFEIQMEDTFLETQPCYQITDYLYYVRLILKISDQERHLLLSNILHDVPASK